MQCGALEWLLEQTRGSGGKPGGTPGTAGTFASSITTF